MGTHSYGWYIVTCTYQFSGAFAVSESFLAQGALAV